MDQSTGSNSRIQKYGLIKSRNGCSTCKYVLLTIQYRAYVDFLLDFERSNVMRRGRVVSAVLARDENVNIKRPRHRRHY